MKDPADQAAADFLQDLERCPDQLLEQPGFRLKRQVKGLYQVVRDLELPVASILSLKLACAATPNAEAPGAVISAVGTQSEQLEQYNGVQAFTQASLRLIVSTVEKAQLDAMVLLKETADIPVQQNKVRTCIKRLFHMERTLLHKSKALPLPCPVSGAKSVDPLTSEAEQVNPAASRGVQNDCSATEQDPATSIAAEDSQPDVGSKAVVGSMERVKHAAVNLDLLTSPAMLDMEAKYQAKLNDSQIFIQGLIDQQVMRNTTYEHIIKTGLDKVARVEKESVFFKDNCDEAFSQMGAMSKNIHKLRDQHQATADAYKGEMETLKTTFADKEANLQQTIDSQKESIGKCEIKVQHTIDMKDAIIALREGEHSKVVQEKDAKIAKLEAQLSKLLTHRQDIKPYIPLKYRQVAQPKVAQPSRQQYHPAKATRTEDTDWSSLAEDISATVSCVAKPEVPPRILRPFSTLKPEFLAGRYQLNRN